MRRFRKRVCQRVHLFKVFSYNCYLKSNSIIFRKYVFAILVGYFLSSIFIQVRELSTNILQGSGALLKNGAPLGGDFSIFYIAGKIFKTAPELLYDFNYQLEQLGTNFKGPDQKRLYLFFVYPPYIAAFFSSFASLGLAKSYLIWSLISLLIAIVSFVLVARELKFSWTQELLLLLGTFSFAPLLMNTIGGGQLSTLGLFVFSLGLVCRLRKVEFFEGCAIGLGFYKPPLFLFFGSLAVIERRWKVVWGATVSVFAQLALCISLIGYEQLINYFKIAVNYRYGQQLVEGVTLPITQGVGIFALVSRILPGTSLNYPVFILIFISCLYLAIRLKAMLKNKDLSCNAGLSYCIEAIFSVALSIQCINYDLILLIPSVMILMAVLLKRANSVVDGATYIIILLLHSEWLLRTGKDGYQYAPFVPFILILLILSAAALIMRQALDLEGRKLKSLKNIEPVSPSSARNEIEPEGL